MFTNLVFFVYLWVQLVYCAAEPLFLTPFIKKGQIDVAEKRAEVKPFLPNVKSYSGYLTVNEKFNSNLFFWFFPTKSNWTAAPLVLWLQGGPGASSMFGLFNENGPYVFKKDKLKKRRHSWTDFFNVLYIDNPVGTGFSFADSSEAHSVNQSMVGEDLHEALRQFLLLFPQMQKNKLILSGESYAGKYVPTLAYTILMKNTTRPKINIYGLFIGNPMINPEDMLPHYSSYLSAHGLLDEKGTETLRKREELILSHIYAKHWVEAAELFEDTFFDGFTKKVTTFEELTGIRNHYNLMKDNLHFPASWINFLNKNSTKRELHVRDDVNFVDFNMAVYKRMKPDIMKSMKPQFGIVMENSRVLIYSGQSDVICPYYLQLQVSKNLDWSGNWDYNQALRQPLRWKKYLSGYYKTAKRYTEVMIRNAGHFVPTDRPQWALGLLQKFVDGSFYKSSGALDLSF